MTPLMGKKIPTLSPKMRRIQRLYALMYLGYVLHILINRKPKFIIKHEYIVQNYLRKILSPRKTNKNETMFELEFKDVLQFQELNSR